MRDDLISFGLAMVHGQRPVQPPADDESLVAYAVDVSDQVAVSIVIERSDSGWNKWRQCWRWGGAKWQQAGQTSSATDAAALHHKRAGGEPSLACTPASGHHLIDSGFWPWSGHYLSWQEFETGGDLTQVEVARSSSREVAVPWHGHVVVAWVSPQRIERFGPGFGVSAGPGKRSPRIAGRTASGRTIAPRTLGPMV